MAEGGIDYLGVNFGREATNKPTPTCVCSVPKLANFAPFLEKNDLKQSGYRSILNSKLLVNLFWVNAMYPRVAGAKKKFY